MDWDKLSDKFGIFGERVGKSLRGVFGDRNSRLVKGLEPQVDAINSHEDWARGLESEEFVAHTEGWRAAVERGEVTLEQLLPQAFALCREASRRTMGMRHFDVQLVGGITLHQGRIAEMMTGEGKTLMATLALYLNSLSGQTCYLVTVNDYLAKRDALWMMPIFDYLGVSCAWIESDMSPAERKPVYDCDIVYGTNNEFGFDYLRDNMKNRVEDQVQKTLHFAIIDEVDSILIDESRTPLIISGPAENMPEKYVIAHEVALKLKQDDHFEVKDKERQVHLLEDGIEAAEKMVGVDSFYTAGNMDWPHYIENALRANYLYSLDDHYVVEPGDKGPEITIVDEFTGRKMTGRRWSDGLHQAVEVKEGLQVRQENQTLATITFQNYFRLYDKLAGMTGTAITEAGEFHKIYELDVVQIPTNLPIAREDSQDVVFRTEGEKWTAICDEIEAVNEAGQPILVGTTSIENSEELSRLLTERGIVHEVLNAKQHEREAHVVAKAGEKHAITVATNMAGRGTDIKLGGNFDYKLRELLEEKGLVVGDPEHLEEIDKLRSELRAECDRLEKEVQDLGGLYVLGTERHESRRIDNQLRGRSGRQGDAGLSRFYLSLEDPLMRRFYRDWVKNFMEKLGMSEGVPIESKMVSRAIEKAQKKVEDFHFEIRKNLLEYDGVMDEQRKTIYTVRQEVLASEGLDDKTTQMIEGSVMRNVSAFTEDPEGLIAWFQRSFGRELDAKIAAAVTAPDADPTPAAEAALKMYDERREELGEEVLERIERYLLLHAIDTRWKDHLHAIDSLKAGIGLRGYAQKDPKNEYKREGYELFTKLQEAIEDEIASLVLRVEVGGEGAARGQSYATPAQVFGGARSVKPQFGAPAQRQAAPVRAAAPVRRPVSASQAFDAMNQQRRIQQALAAQQAKRAGAEGGAPAGAAPAAPAARPAPAPGATRVATNPAPSSRPIPKPAPQAPVQPEVGRNDPCPCGSGKKYKKCHGA
ncbi:MAG: preprotein translocase subunit SecA [Planctomycetota bacterium]|nr:preprotein translocase subunit SecA [Planctomycetota bacterium]